MADYVKHVGLVREMLNQASLSENPAVLTKCANKLYKSLAGLLTSESSCSLTREPIPAWNTVKVVRTNPIAELVARTISLMIHDPKFSLERAERTDAYSRYGPDVRDASSIGD